jgi:hypothetical protein
VGPGVGVRNKTANKPLAKIRVRIRIRIRVRVRGRHGKKRKPLAKIIQN